MLGVIARLRQPLACAPADGKPAVLLHVSLP